MAAGGAHVRHRVAGFFHQVRHKNIQIAGHHGLVLGLGSAAQVDIVQCLPHHLHILAVVHRVRVRERRLLHQLVGVRAVEAHPVILPRFNLVRGVGDELVRLGQKQIALLQGIGGPIDLVHALSGHNEVNQIVVAHTGPPRMARQTGLMPAVKNRKLYIVCVALLIGLLHLIDGHDGTSLV